jgi:hypothetical protein
MMKNKRPSNERFFDLLERCPRIVHLWDKERSEMNVDLFEEELTVMSKGEVHLALFMASVWFGNANRYYFDLADAVSAMDSKERRIIIDWIADPFWP